MINEFSARVKNSNNNARVAFIAFLVAGGATVLAYSIIPTYKGVVGLVAVALLTAAVLVYTRYMAPIYFYEITHDYEGTPIFVVRQVTGRRETTLARITLADITSVDVEGKTERKSHKTDYGTKKYTYTPSLGPSVTCRITAKSRYERSEITIEAGEDFAAMLRAYVNEARTLRIAKYDDE